MEKITTYKATVIQQPDIYDATDFRLQKVIEKINEIVEWINKIENRGIVVLN
jgi:hypothetical protein